MLCYNWRRARKEQSAKGRARRFSAFRAPGALLFALCVLMTMISTRIRELRRKVERARERFEATRPEEYQRPQDFRRARTVQMITLHRAERRLAAAEARQRVCLDGGAGGRSDAPANC